MKLEKLREPEVCLDFLNLEEESKILIPKKIILLDLEENVHSGAFLDCNYNLQFIKLIFILHFYMKTNFLNLSV